MEGLNTEYMSNLMKICTLKPNTFKGVFSCDNFYNNVKNRHVNLFPGDKYIINLSSSNHPGSHWVAIKINKSKSAEYFDSFGLDCFDKFIKSACEERNISLVPFKKAIQHPFSQLCGYFCIAYLICRDVNISKTEFAEFFSSQKLKDNDNIAVHIINTYIEAIGSLVHS